VLLDRGRLAVLPLAVAARAGEPHHVGRVVLELQGARLGHEVFNIAAASKVEGGV